MPSCDVIGLAAIPAEDGNRGTKAQTQGLKDADAQCPDSISQLVGNGDRGDKARAGAFVLSKLGPPKMLGYLPPA